MPTATIHKRKATNHFYDEILDVKPPLRMMQIPAGEFLMGSPDSELERFNNESQQHPVSVSSLFMAKYTVTQSQWRAVAAMPQVERKLNPNPSNFKGDTRPVEKVSWFDAIEFCARLSKHTKRQYRLPTEAEWEYACRAGTTTPFHFGETISTELANYNGSAYADGPTGRSRGETTHIDYFDIANAWGLSDMHGNVWEWCQDHWHDDYQGAPKDGSAWLSNDDSRHVVRGGSWFFYPRDCRSAYRDFNNPGNRNDNIGFRVACAAPGPDCRTHLRKVKR
jgi:formylglycine-generating enzyme required for sulfatase activity